MGLPVGSKGLRAFVGPTCLGGFSRAERRSGSEGGQENSENSPLHPESPRKCRTNPGLRKVAFGSPPSRISSRNVILEGGGAHFGPPGACRGPLRVCSIFRGWKVQEGRHLPGASPEVGDRQRCRPAVAGEEMEGGVTLLPALRADVLHLVANPGHVGPEDGGVARAELGQRLMSRPRERKLLPGDLRGRATQDLVGGGVASTSATAAVWRALTPALTALGDPSAAPSRPGARPRVVRKVLLSAGPTYSSSVGQRGQNRGGRGGGGGSSGFILKRYTVPLEAWSAA